MRCDESVTPNGTVDPRLPAGRGLHWRRSPRTSWKDTYASHHCARRRPRTLLVGSRCTRGLRGFVEQPGHRRVGWLPAVLPSAGPLGRKLWWGHGGVAELRRKQVHRAGVAVLGRFMGDCDNPLILRRYREYTSGGDRLFGGCDRGMGASRGGQRKLVHRPGISVLGWILVDAGQPLLAIFGAGQRSAGRRGCQQRCHGDVGCMQQQ